MEPNRLDQTQYSQYPSSARSNQPPADLDERVARLEEALKNMQAAMQEVEERKTAPAADQSRIGASIQEKEGIIDRAIEWIKSFHR